MDTGNLEKKVCPFIEDNPLIELKEFFGCYIFKYDGVPLTLLSMKEFRDMSLCRIVYQCRLCYFENKEGGGINGY